MKWLKYGMIFLAASVSLFAKDDLDDVIENASKRVIRRLRDRMKDPTTPVRIGVFNFERLDTYESLTYHVFENYVNDQIVLTLMKNRGKLQFEVVERNSLEKVIREQDFGASDYVNQDQSVQVGRLLNANVIIVGTYQPLKEYILVNTKLVDVETGSILEVMSYEMEIDARVDNLLGIGDEKLRQEEEKRRQKEYEKSLAKPKDKFFGGGMSGYYSWTSGKPTFKNFMATVDFGLFFRRIIAKAGYSKYSREVDGHYMIFGGDFKIYDYLRFGYMRGISLKKDETIADNLAGQSSTAGIFYWTPIEGDGVSFSILRSSVNGNNLWGLGLSFY